MAILYKLSICWEREAPPSEQAQMRTASMRLVREVQRAAKEAEKVSFLTG